MKWSFPEGYGFPGNLPLLLCSRCVYDARPHLKHAPKPHLGGIIFSFFWLSKSTIGEKEVFQKVMTFREINLSLLLCSRCIYDARSHLKHAPKLHLGGIIFSTQKS